MALPKRRHSRTRSRLRRGQDKLTPPVITRCGECGVSIAPHRACPKCGAFKGKRDVIKVRVRAKK
jgi:large subunit ribosomal protein L32